MNMYNIKTLLIVLFVSLLVLPQLSLAQQEYVEDYWWMDVGVTREDYFSQHSPKVACSDSNPDYCVVVFYWSGDWFDPATKIVVRWTFDGFTTTPAVGQWSAPPVSVNLSAGVDMLIASRYDDALPLDVYHNGTDFIVIFDRGGSDDNRVYTFDPITKIWSLAWTLPRSVSLIKIQEVNGVPLVFGMERDLGIQDIYLRWYYLINGTVESTVTTIFAIPVNPTRLLVSKGFVARSGSTTRYDLIYATTDGGGVWQTYAAKDMGAFASTYSTLWYWDGSRLFYSIHNHTATPPDGDVRYVETSDLSTFGAITLYYTFNETVEQFINYTDYDDSGGRSTFVYHSHTNQTAYFGKELEGLFGSQRELKRLNIYPTSLDLNDGSVDAINISAVLTCDDFSFTASGSGDFISLLTPCENNTLTLVAPSGFEPFTSIVNDIELTDDCPITSIVIDDYLSEYDLEVRTRDIVFFVPIDGVLVNVGGTTNTTNVQGKATIPNFFPVSGADFIRGTKTSCAYDFSFDGTPDVLSVTGTKSGYETFTDTETFATEPFFDPFASFERDYLMEMTPPATEIEVKAYTLDNVEIESSSSQILVSVYGADNFFLFDEGIYYEQNTASELPSQFLLVDNRSTWSVNVTLDFYGQYYQLNETVTQGGFKTIKFTVNFTSIELPCETNLDCPDGFCDGKYFKLSRGCNMNQCEYTTQVCKSTTLCDDERGCFDAQGTSSCEDDTDCLNESICLSTKKSRVGLCGSNDICIFKDTLCRHDCNQTTGLCAESEICLELGQLRHRFLIQTTTQPFIEGVYTTYIDTDYYCGLDNRGQRECISGAVVPITVDLVGVTTLPDAWAFTSNASDYIFHDIAIVCDTLCNVTHTYCEYGCNDETGFCHIEPFSPEGQVSIYTSMVVGWWYLIFPTSAAQTIAYIFIALGVSAAITYYTGKNGSGNNGLTFLGATIAIVLAGVPLGTIPFFVGVIYAVIAGYLVMKMWRGA